MICTDMVDHYLKQLVTLSQDELTTLKTNLTPRQMKAFNIALIIKNFN